MVRSLLIGAVDPAAPVVVAAGPPQAARVLVNAAATPMRAGQLEEVPAAGVIDQRQVLNRLAHKMPHHSV